MMLLNLLSYLMGWQNLKFAIYLSSLAEISAPINMKE